MDAQKIQEQFYKETAHIYDNQHLSEDTDVEHMNAIAWMESIVTRYNIRSILDIGAGTGRTISHFKAKFPNIKIVGIEPVKELREIGYAKGIKPSELFDGNGNALDFKDNEFDLVCEFAVLHHVPEPVKMVQEMLRVAGKGIFISDTNNYGQGSHINRWMKRTIRRLGLWKKYQYIVTKGKMYHISEGDGLFYSYSVFNNYNQIKKTFKNIQVLGYLDEGVNPINDSPHVALFAHNKRS